MKIAKHKLLLIILSVIYINVYAQRDTIPVNIEWQFSIDKKAEGLAGKWFEGNLTNARAVQLPHTWNVEEADQNHYGWGWYQKKKDIPAGWSPTTWPTTSSPTPGSSAPTTCPRRRPSSSAGPRRRTSRRCPAAAA